MNTPLIAILLSPIIHGTNFIVVCLVTFLSAEVEI